MIGGRLTSCQAAGRVGRTGARASRRVRQSMSLSELRGFAFDLDGCIWAGPTLLPGAADLVAALRDAGRRVVFVTNSSRERAASLAGRLSRLGIPTAPEDVLAAIELLGEAIRRRHGAVG